MSATSVQGAAPDEDRMVAVIGMACRFAGADSPTELWNLLRDQVDATGETPLERYDADAVQGADRAGIGSRAGYLSGMADFDASFFAMSPAEATDLDPQQRQLLMVSWEALEDAGQQPDQLTGSRTGVFVGNTRSDFLERQFRQGPSAITPDAYHNFRPLQPARLSHFFDLRGPSLTVDTACASSLSAVHLAVQSLRTGESPLAIVAGVNLALRPDESIMMARAGTLAADGRSRFGDAAADGFAPSDGIGVLILKPLTAARADGDRIRAIIRGSAVGNDGRTSDALLTPSTAGQIDILQWAYQDARVSPGDVDFVEAHGSGLPALDAAELTAIGTVLGADRPADRPVHVGAVKNNIGHAEAAGGMAGLIKSVLSLEHGQLPATLHHRTPTPLVDWSLPISVPTDLRALPDRGRPLLAGVSGQGGSALNAHVVLAQGETSKLRARPDTDDGRSFQLQLSAASPPALEALTRRYLEYLAPSGAGSCYAVSDICFSAATRRHRHSHRLTVTGSSHRELIIELERRLDDHRVDTIDAADQYFEPDARFVPLPSYPWQTERYWPGDRPTPETADLAGSLIRLHARSGAATDDDTLLAEVGIDSLARLEITAGLAEDFGYQPDIEELARLRTVGDLRGWVDALQEADR